MERYTYRWTYLPSGETGTVERLFLSRNAFLESVSCWNACSSSWKYEETSTVDATSHKAENDSVYIGPFQFYENPLANVATIG